MHSSNLPPAFRGVPFSTRDALDAGIAPNRLRSAGLRAPHSGVRAPLVPLPATLRDRCLELLPRLAPLQIFCGVTASGLWGAPLPPRAEAFLHIGALLATREPRIPGVIGHRLALPPGEVSFADGLPVPSPAEAWAQLGAVTRSGSPRSARRRSDWPLTPAQTTRSLLTLDDLVAVGDHLVARGLTTEEELREAAAVARRRGAIALREACEWIRAGVESPKETELRLLLLRNGMPEPEVNWDLRDAASRFIARVDLAYPRYRVAVEYDGRHHAEIEQFARDADRWAAIDASDWILVRVLSHHLADPHRSVLPRVRRALRSRGWEPAPGG